MNGERLEAVDSFKYLGATITEDGRSVAEVKIRLATATSAMSRLSKMWRSKEISFPSKMKLFRSLVLSILLYGCESWTLTAELERRIEAFETKSYRRMLGISWFQHKTNEYVLNKVFSLAGPQEPLLSIVKRRKLSWFGHTTRHDSLSKTILQGTLEGKRKRGRQRKCWMDNIKDWTQMNMAQLLKKANDRPGWRELSSAVSLMTPQRPSVTGQI